MSLSSRVIRIAIFTDEPGWHGAQLKAWFAAHGAPHADPVELTEFLLRSVPGFE